MVLDDWKQDLAEVLRQAALVVVEMVSERMDFYSFVVVVERRIENGPWTDVWVLEIDDETKTLNGDQRSWTQICVC